MITSVPYRPAWRDEFCVRRQHLRAHLGELAQRLDQIGSTAVPGLAAKAMLALCRGGKPQPALQ